MARCAWWYTCCIMRRSFGMQHVNDLLERWFPMPPLLSPRSVGIDISDKSIKWLALSDAARGFTVHAYGSEPLPEGVVHNGLIANGPALAEHLKMLLHPLGGVRHAHAALPEEEAYVFSMSVPLDSSREQIMRLIEFEFEGRVPISPAEAVFDYDRIEDTPEGTEIGVAVFPRSVAEQYAEAFDQAGIRLLSLEIEAQSIARAVMPRNETQPITLIADFGRARTGFALVKNGVPMFTTTVGVGGDAISTIVQDAVGGTETDLERFKNEEGLLAEKADAKLMEAMRSASSALADEIARHFHYWDTRRNERGERMTPVGHVMLVGGSSNLKGLADLIASRVQAPTSRGNVWCNICSFEDYIPPINRHDSLEYATAVGLALRGV